MKIKEKIVSMIKNYMALRREKELISIPQMIPESQLLKGKVALITGGTSGIGLAIAESFIGNGAKVIVCGTNKTKLDDTLSKLRMMNSASAQGLLLDISNVNEIGNRIIQASQMFDDNRIDILVNSAGVNNPHTFFDITEEDYDNVMDINAKGTFFISQKIGKYMIEKGIKGHILFISSSSAVRPASTPYIMSKWVVRGMTLGVADCLLPYGITVNAIAPGPVVTPMLNKSNSDNLYNPHTVSGRYADPREIANLATYMASDFGKMVIGDTCYITGGSGLLDLHR